MKTATHATEQGAQSALAGERYQYEQALADRDYEARMQVIDRVFKVGRALLASRQDLRLAGARSDSWRERARLAKQEAIVTAEYEFLIGGKK